MTIRPAGAGERTLVADLLAEAAAERVGRRGEAERSRRTGPVAGEEVVLVAVDAGGVVGTAVGRVADGGPTGRRGVLEACYVVPAARRRGHGRALVAGMVARLEAAGVDGVDGFALPGDRTAKQLFEAAGFKARLLTMYRPTARPGSDGAG